MGLLSCSLKLRFLFEWAAGRWDLFPFFPKDFLVGLGAGDPWWEFVFVVFGLCLCPKCQSNGRVCSYVCVVCRVRVVDCSDDRVGGVRDMGLGRVQRAVCLVMGDVYAVYS